METETEKILKLKHVHVLCCFALFVCLTLLASFFLPSHLSFKNMYTVFIGSVCNMLYSFVNPFTSCVTDHYLPQQYIIIQTIKRLAHGNYRLIII